MAATKLISTLYIVLLLTACLLLVYLIIFFQQGWEAVFVNDVLLVLLVAPLLLLLALVSFTSLLFTKHPMVTSMPLFASCGLWAMLVLFGISGSLDASRTVRYASAVEAAPSHELPLNSTFGHVDMPRQARFDRVYCDAQGHKICDAFPLPTAVALLQPRTPFFANLSTADVLSLFPNAPTLEAVCATGFASEKLPLLPALCGRCSALDTATAKLPVVRDWLRAQCPLEVGDVRAVYCAVYSVPGVWSRKLYEETPHPFQGECYGAKMAVLRRDYVEGVGYVALFALLVTLELVWLNRRVVLDLVKPPLHDESQSRPSWSEIS
ncbi:hypothetical protein SPRG_10037 [Saprolegnia parasitica CBS 223.65]|uniref:Uncharacterized protein n=1 Tax=Saprolegnia parasitica (strain CBS 223.65) TaxID=695850 RepID=A0A067CAP3_SAPPC|nr:hypothetical protein SPRG_10037 [Saprolegnia parasitica CBS 223.65]KDO23892.1 hypothetical protein SPRG_10037 [Saprolegnia parasitica CBS 223.65]|eukprot:XP_012205362.1 hypothetical protein SPRG_10037 [Saprolegnia parasitica CBS 223.65]